MKIPSIASLPGIFACLFPLCSSVVEAAVTYTYQGTLSSSVAAPLESGDSVTGSVTFAESIVTGVFAATDFLDYSFQVAGFQLSREDGSDVSARLEVNGEGMITSWSFVIGDYEPAASPRLIEIWTNSADLSPPGERITMANSSGVSILASVAPSGTWTLVPIPEPASTILLAISSAALFVRRR
jgi:hypothetical protein